MSSAPGKTPQDAGLSPAKRTVGRYELRAPLGAGMAGEVWRAEDPRIGRSVAIKFLKIPEGLSPANKHDWERRFLLEAQAAGRLSHPGIVSIHDVGTSDDGRPYIVMELVEGKSLDALRLAAIPPTLDQVVDFTIQIAEALDAAHKRGVVHRDVKPANILVDGDGRARIADFGIARLAGSDLTRDGAFLGSPAFAAPEQIRGKEIDGRADLFSLGAVFYTLATGHRPFDGDDIAAVAYAVCHSEPLPPSLRDPSIPAAYDAVAAKALAKEAAARFRTGAEFAQALRDARNAPVAAADVEKTAVDAPAVRLAEPSAEERAATWASAAAVQAVRAGRTGSAVARSAWGHAEAYVRRQAPVVAEGMKDAWGRAVPIAAASARKVASGVRRLEVPRVSIPRRTLWIAAGVAALLLLAVAGRALVTKDAKPHRSLVAQLREIAGGNSAQVRVVVVHGFEDAVIEVRGEQGTLLRRGLSAPRKEVLGLSFLSYRSGKDAMTLRLAPGEHDLTVAVTGDDGAVLAKEVHVNVEAKAAYRLEISVRTWPWTRLASDFRRQDE